MDKPPVDEGRRARRAHVSNEEKPLLVEDSVQNKYPTPQTGPIRVVKPKRRLRMPNRRVMSILIAVAIVLLLAIGVLFIVQRNSGTQGRQEPLEPLGISMRNFTTAYNQNAMVYNQAGGVQAEYILDQQTSLTGEPYDTLPFLSKDNNVICTGLLDKKTTELVEINVLVPISRVTSTYDQRYWELTCIISGAGLAATYQDVVEILRQNNVADETGFLTTENRNFATENLALKFEFDNSTGYVTVRIQKKPANA